jgi:hypothetical protein
LIGDAVAAATAESSDVRLVSSESAVVTEIDETIFCSVEAVAASMLLGAATAVSVKLSSVEIDTSMAEAVSMTVSPLLQRVLKRHLQQRR